MGGKGKKNMYSNLMLNGNSMSQNTKPFAPNHTFSGKNTKEGDYSKDSLVGENENLGRAKLNTDTNLKIIDGATPLTKKKKIHKVVSSSNSKNHINSQFFGQRNSKHHKLRNETLKNSKQGKKWEDQNLSKMSINQRLDREHSTGVRKTKSIYKSEKISGSTYSATKPSSKGK